MSRWEEIPSHTEKIHHMQYPVWTKPALLGAGCGAIAIIFIGFSQLGWKTSRAAADMAQEQADAAVVTALVPFCVAKAGQMPEQDTLAKVKADDSAFSRSDLVHAEPPMPRRTDSRSKNAIPWAMHVSVRRPLGSFTT